MHSIQEERGTMALEEEETGRNYPDYINWVASNQSISIMMTRMWNTMLFNLNNENIGKGRYYNGIHNRVYVLEKRTKAITSTTTIGRMMDTIDIHHQRMRTTIKTKIFSVIPRWGRIAVPRTTTAISLTLRYFGRRRRRITHTRHASLIMD